MNKENVNLGKYDLNKLLRNPGLIHRIQDNLQALKGDDFLSNEWRRISKDTPDYCIKTIIEHYRDNPPMITKLVGKETLKLIEEYENITLANDLDNLFN